MAPGMAVSAYEDMVCMGPAYDVRDVGGMTAVRLYLEVLKGLALGKSKQS